ncbi:hypothetical protein IFR05_009954 [Cadophora sp. M221]|nr:hypothetical protein IFR05_009954 [Cadophora sp. M221]
MTATHLSLDPIAFKAAAEAYWKPSEDIRQGVRWLERGRSVLVRLETPDLPFWNANEQVDENQVSSLIFNFTLQDRRILLLNDVPIFPLQNAYVPPRLYAHQSAINLVSFEHGLIPSFDESPLYAIDYHRALPVSEHPSAHYNVFKTQVELDVLGAGIAGQNTLLPDKTQRLILLSIDETGPFQKYPYTKSISEVDLTLSDTLLRDRFPHNTPFFTPQSLKKCTLWSWRCPDIAEYPWYRYVYREAFDEYGKIGSFRHMLLQVWRQLREPFGFWQMVMVLVVAKVLLLTPIFYRLHRAAIRTKRHVKGLYTRREEVDLYRTDAEAVGLLNYEDNEDAGDNEKNSSSDPGVIREIHGEPSTGRVDFGKPLPPIPTATSDMR